MYIRMYDLFVCMYLCTYVCMYVCMYAHICQTSFTYLHIHKYIHTRIHTYTHTHIHIYQTSFTYLHTHTLIHTYIHICQTVATCDVPNFLHAWLLDDDSSSTDGPSTRVYRDDLTVEGASMRVNGNVDGSSTEVNGDVDGTSTRVDGNCLTVDGTCTESGTLHRPDGLASRQHVECEKVIYMYIYIYIHICCAQTSLYPFKAHKQLDTCIRGCCIRGCIHVYVDTYTCIHGCCQGPITRDVRYSLTTL
jgi:hypothetical protein